MYIIVCFKNGNYTLIIYKAKCQNDTEKLVKWVQCISRRTLEKQKSISLYQVISCRCQLTKMLNNRACVSIFNSNPIPKRNQHPPTHPLLPKLYALFGVRRWHCPFNRGHATCECEVLAKKNMTLTQLNFCVRFQCQIHRWPEVGPHNYRYRYISAVNCLYFPFWFAGRFFFCLRFWICKINIPTITN